MDVDYRHAPLAARVSPPDARVRWKGFTLVEFLVVTAIAALILAFAVPSFSSMLQETRLSTTLNSLVHGLQLARSEAIKRQRTIVICKGGPETGCDNQRSWDSGWLIFVDIDRNHDVSPNEPMIWSHPALNDRTSIAFSAFPTDNYVVYYPSGAASSNGTFTFCDDRGNNAAKALILAKTGRLRVSDTAADGSALQCGE